MWRGGAETVHTGIWKRPVAGPSTVRRLNIDGDGQGDLAGHGGEQRAVLVYQIESYRHWQEHLGRDDFEYGQFGENFTVDGMPDDEVCIGDRYRIGGAVFEVTQPRVTCYRVGLRLQEPQMPALLVSHRRPGFYLRVITEGEVEAGEEIVKVASGPEGVTVAEIDALLYLPGHPRDALARALRIPALSPGWKTSLSALLEHDESDAAQGNAGLVAVSPPPAWPGFRPLRATAIASESDSVMSLRLAATDGEALPPALPGQFVTLRLESPDLERPLLRSYSLSGRPGEAEYRISVKREVGGLGSGYLHARLHVGDTVPVAAPRGVFTLVPGDRPLILAVSAASAPRRCSPCCTSSPLLVRRDASGGCTAPAIGTSIRSRRRCASSSRNCPNAQDHIWYSRPGPDDKRGDDYHSAGRISAAVLGTLDIPHEADAYLCGPSAFMADATTDLIALGIDAARIRTEIFGTPGNLNPGVVGVAGAAPHPPAGERGNGPAVSFARSDLTVPWGPDYASLLELAEACDVPSRWSCRTGVCHTCETGLLAGSVTFSPEPIDPPPPGTVLICCARPGGDLVLDL